MTLKGRAVDVGAVAFVVEGLADSEVAGGGEVGLVWRGEVRGIFAGEGVEGCW